MYFKIFLLVFPLLLLECAQHLDGISHYELATVAPGGGGGYGYGYGNQGYPQQKPQQQDYYYQNYGAGTGAGGENGNSGYPRQTYPNGNGNGNQEYPRQQQVNYQNYEAGNRNPGYQGQTYPQGNGNPGYREQNYPQVPQQQVYPNSGYGQTHPQHPNPPQNPEYKVVYVPVNQGGQEYPRGGRGEVYPQGGDYQHQQKPHFPQNQGGQQQIYNEPRFPQGQNHPGGQRVPQNPGYGSELQKYPIQNNEVQVSDYESQDYDESQVQTFPGHLVSRQPQYQPYTQRVTNKQHFQNIIQNPQIQEALRDISRGALHHTERYLHPEMYQGLQELVNRGDSQNYREIMGTSATRMMIGKMGGNSVGQALQAGLDHYNQNGRNFEDASEMAIQSFLKNAQVGRRMADGLISLGEWLPYGAQVLKLPFVGSTIKKVVRGASEFLVDHAAPVVIKGAKTLWNFVKGVWHEVFNKDESDEDDEERERRRRAWKRQQHYAAQQQVAEDEGEWEQEQQTSVWRNALNVEVYGQSQK